MVRYALTMLLLLAVIRPTRALWVPHYALLRSRTVRIHSYRLFSSTNKGDASDGRDASFLDSLSDINLEALRDSIDTNLDDLKYSIDTNLDYLKGSIDTGLDDLKESIDTNIEDLKGSLRDGNWKDSVQDLKDSLGFNLEDLKDHVVKARERAGLAMTVLGFSDSVAQSILTDRAQFHRWKPRVDALTAYLKTSGLEEEIGLDKEPSLEVATRLIESLKIFAGMQEDALTGDRRDEFVTDKFTLDDVPSWEEAERYMRYATACYGDAAMMGANVEVRGDVDFRFVNVTKERISEHTGIPERDLILVDVNYSGLADYLRHYIAVDHENQKVVLAIRGTWSLSDVLTDVSGYSRDFCGGEAHSGMSNFVEGLWDRIGGTVLEQLERYPNYELVLTGHSLGAGSANLLNIFLHEDDSRRVSGRQIRCFSYASPPVFTPLDAAPEAVSCAINYIHEMDDVPFLCGDTVRRLFAAIGVLEETLKNMDRSKRKALLMGTRKPNPLISKCVLQASLDPLPFVAGVPPLAIPAKTTVWLCEQKNGKYNAKLCDPLLLAQSAIHLDPDIFFDHLPARYEYCLNNVES